MDPLAVPQLHPTEDFWDVLKQELDKEGWDPTMNRFWEERSGSFWMIFVGMSFEAWFPWQTPTRAVFEIKTNWWSPKLKAGGSGGPPPEKISNLRWLNPLKFNSDSLSYGTENCRRLFPVRMIFTSLMTLKVKNKTWISNFQVHLQAETNLPFQFMFNISSNASTEKSWKLFLNVENCSELNKAWARFLFFLCFCTIVMQLTVS